MKKIALTFAALAALSGSAFAGALDVHKQAPQQACVQMTNGNVDCTATGSVEKTHSAVDTSSVKDGKPRLGIDVNPFLFPNY